MKNLYTKIGKTVVILNLLCQASYSSENIPDLDAAWSMFYGNSAPKLSHVIGMPKINSKQAVNAQNPIRVAVLECSTVKPEACNLSESCFLPDSLLQDEDREHATMVANIIKSISLTAQIHSYAAHKTTNQWIQALNQVAAMPNIDVINMSMGFSTINGQLNFLEDSFLSKAMESAADAGKILVLAFGNQREILGNAEHEFFCEMLQNMAKRPQMKGRLILVSNSEYSKSNDKMSKSSSHVYSPCQYAITAPGTDITTLSDKDKVSTSSGTSFAAPIVSGIIAELLKDLQGYKDLYLAFNLGTNEDFKDLIIQEILKNTRKSDLRGNPLSVEFGQGIINYQQAKNVLEGHLDELINQTLEVRTAAEAKAAAEAKETIVNNYLLRYEEINNEIKKIREQLTENEMMLLSAISRLCAQIDTLESEQTEISKKIIELTV